MKPGASDRFIELFESFDSPAQVTDGVLCRDENDPEHFYLIAEWKDKAAHRARYFETGKKLPAPGAA